MAQPLARVGMAGVGIARDHSRHTGGLTGVVENAQQETRVHSASDGAAIPQVSLRGLRGRLLSKACDASQHLAKMVLFHSTALALLSETGDLSAPLVDMTDLGPQPIDLLRHAR